MLGRKMRLAAMAAAVFLLAAAGALWFLAGPALDRLARIGPWTVAGLLALSAVNYAIRAWRWQVFTRSLGLGIGWRDNALCFVAGFAFTATPGKIGEAVRLWLMHRRHGCRYERIASLFWADRLNDAGAILLLTGAAAAVGADKDAGVIGVSAGALLLVTALLLRPDYALRVVSAVYAALRWNPHLFARLRTTLRNGARLASWRTYGGTLVAAAFGWLAEGMAFYWLLIVLGAEIGPAEAVAIFGIAMMVGAISMLPGGLGGMEATMVGLLLLRHVPPDIAIAAAVVIRITTLWFAVGLGFIALPLALRGPRQGYAGPLPDPDAMEPR
jgi:uncharacterized protein (TIRG00374 family)